LIKTFRHLQIALFSFGAVIARPVANRIGAEQMINRIFFDPEFQLIFQLESRIKTESPTAAPESRTAFSSLILADSPMITFFSAVSCPESWKQQNSNVHHPNRRISGYFTQRWK